MILEQSVDHSRLPSGIAVIHIEKVVHLDILPEKLNIIHNKLITSCHCHSQGLRRVDGRLGHDKIVTEMM
jgi:hypothetical protein